METKVSVLQANVCLTRKCQVTVERRVLDLESEAWVLFPLGVTFCHWIFFLFSQSKDENGNIGISVRM